MKEEEYVDFDRKSKKKKVRQNLFKLSRHMIDYILSYIEIDHLFRNLSLVCKFWYEIIPQAIKELNMFSFSDKLKECISKNEEKFINTLQKCTLLKSCSIVRSYFLLN